MLRKILALALLFPTLSLAGGFEDLGVPVGIGAYRGLTVGPDSTGKGQCVYIVFMQSGPLLLVAVDPASGQKSQYLAPKDADTLPKGMVRAGQPHLHLHRRQGADHAIRPHAAQ